MQEFWFCEACKSMNRGDADKCYRCRAPKAHATMATVHERRLEGVMMPGVDQLEPGAARAMLAQHPYDVAWPYGYVSVALLILAMLFQIGFAIWWLAVLVTLHAPSLDTLGGYAFGGYTLGAGWSGFEQISLWGYVAASIGAAVVHSVFLALTDTNVPALGGGQPRFGPAQAAAWWIEALGWAWRANLTVWIPLYICLRSAEIVGGFGPLGVLGLMFGIALIWLSIRLLGSPLYSLRKPGRLLEDLTRRLALRGSSDSGLASMWSAAWGTARMIDLMGPVVVVGAVFAMAIVSIFEMLRTTSGAAPDFGLGTVLSSFYAITLLITVLVIAELVANSIALFLLARVTLSLCDSERARRRWVIESAGRPAGRVPNAGAYPAGFMPSAQIPAAPPASAVDSPAGAAARPPWTTAQPAMSEPPRPVAPTAPAPPVPRPRWIGVQAELAGENARAALRPTEPRPTQPPPTAPSAETPPNQPPAAESPTAPSPAPPPVEPAPAAESAKPVLRPSSSMSRYRVPESRAARRPEASPAEEEPVPLQPDWPEGI
ncbi:MAG: hypothetical protein ABSA21_07690 [Candidatus Limnocylindrales bacterium]|jgi:hypothetical protein